MAVQQTAHHYSFSQLNNLACETNGAKVIFSTDDFFAPASNLLKREPVEFKTDAFTEFGKWMDGWETRRKRIPGHDWCIIQLGVPGVIRGFDVDTSFFTGNYAPHISIQAVCLQQDVIKELPLRGDKMGTAASEEEYQCIKKMCSESWVELVPFSKVKPGYTDSCHNYFPVSCTQRWTHIRLNIYPDGGIARLKVYGIGQRDWSEVTPTQKVDLVALINGGVCIGFSDAHFGHPRNMIGAGTAINMGDGWETARRLDRPSVLTVDENGILQVPGSEWAVFKLGHIGVITEIQIDTTHFKGNFPDSCKIDACSMTSEEEMTTKWESDVVTDWKPLLVTQKLKPHHQHFFTGSSIQLTEAVTHVKITMAPDGGISRMRLWGYLRSSPSK
ncbi:allantoicase [Erpetoichthys calabaricus]|uniref:Allantoate amidinohydrolase n=1 Tax=Erpetoichthys calabaricus TaxID=27687 RepID=A0A8C4X9V9_ERPCA|nr:allantoicase [Erpetoichthys calabaricus]